MAKVIELVFEKFRGHPTGIPATAWTETGVSSAASSQTITHAAETGNTHFIAGLHASVDGTAGQDAIQIDLKDDTTIIGNFAMHDQITINFDPPIPVSRGNKIDLDIGAAAASRITNATMWGFTVEE